MTKLNDHWRIWLEQMRNCVPEDEIEVDKCRFRFLGTKLNVTIYEFECNTCENERENLYYSMIPYHHFEYHYARYNLLISWEI